jgi:hypothetical protein
MPSEKEGIVMIVACENACCRIDDYAAIGLRALSQPEMATEFHIILANDFYGPFTSPAPAAEW